MARYVSNTHGKWRLLKYKILLVLLGIGGGVKVHLVGEISISEFFYVLYFMYFFCFHKDFWKIREYKTVTLLYVGLLASQIVSEIAVGNTPDNALRGIAVTVVSFCYLTFLIKMFMIDRSLVLWVIVGIIFRYVLWPSSFEDSLEASLENENAKFFKSFLCPVISNILLAVSVLWHVRILPQIMLFFALIFFIVGARSSALILFMAAFVSWFFLSGKRISKKKLTRSIMTILILSYGLYVVYANAVLSGQITGGNSTQLINSSNPYNPFNLLKQGRSEVFIGWIAFMDKPLFGHGSWAQDVGYKYHTLYSKIRNDDEKFDRMTFTGHDVIPTHSVIISMGTMNGILAFAFMLAIIYFFLKRGIRLILYSNDRYLIVISFFFFSLCWNSLFSPLSHFRGTLPLYMAFILVSYILYIRRDEERQIGTRCPTIYNKIRQPNNSRR